MPAHTRFMLLAALATVSSFTAVSALDERDMSELTTTVQPVPSRSGGAAVSMASLDKRGVRDTLTTIHPVPRSAAPDEAPNLEDMMRKDYGGVGTQTETRLKPRTARPDEASRQDEGAVRTVSAARMEARALASPDAARPNHSKREKRRLPTYRWQDLDWVDGVAIVDDCQTMIMTVIDCNKRTASEDCTAISHFAETGETEFSRISFDDLYIVNRQNANRETLW